MLHNAVALPTFAGRATIYAEGRVAKSCMFERAPLCYDKKAPVIPGVTARGVRQMCIRDRSYILQRAPLFSDKNAAFIPGLPALGFLQLGFRVQPFIENKFHIV